MFKWLNRKKRIKKAMTATTAVGFDPSLGVINPTDFLNSDPDSGSSDSSDSTPCDTSSSDDAAGACDSGGFDGGGGDAGGGGASGDL